MQMAGPPDIILGLLQLFLPHSHSTRGRQYALLGNTTVVGHLKRFRHDTPWSIAPI